MGTFGNFVYPGVKVVESIFGPVVIEQVGHRTIYLIGTALRGPINKLVLVTSPTEYAEQFGGASSTSYLDEAIQAIFENAEVPVYVGRVIGASGSAVATKTLNAGATPTLKIDSIGPGADYNYVASPAAGLSVTYEPVEGLLSVFDKGELKETWYGVTAANSTKSGQQVNAGSRLIQITWLSTAASPDAASSAQGLLTGANGVAVVAADIVGTETAPKKGIGLLADDTLEPGYALAPGWPDETVGDALVSVAERYWKTALIDSTFGISSSAAITERNQYASDKGHGIYCYGWARTLNRLTGEMAWVPRSPFRAAHIARSHDNRGGLANVGAGIEFELRGAVDIETSALDDVGHGELNRKGVDVARDFSRFGQGLVHWSARTISTNTLYKFLQVRTIFNVLRYSIQLGLKGYVFKPIDARGQLSEEIKASIEGLLYDIWVTGALFGNEPKDAFKVVVKGTLTQLEQGILPVEVYVKPTPVAERIPVTLFRVPLNLDLRTGKVVLGSVEEQV